MGKQHFECESHDWVKMELGKPHGNKIHTDRNASSNVQNCSPYWLVSWRPTYVAGDEILFWSHDKNLFKCSQKSCHINRRDLRETTEDTNEGLQEVFNQFGDAQFLAGKLLRMQTGNRRTETGACGDDGIVHILLRIQDIYWLGFRVMGPLFLVHSLFPKVWAIDNMNHSLSLLSEYTKCVILSNC